MHDTLESVEKEPEEVLSPIGDDMEVRANSA
jgi:hypothetical protein